MKITDALLAEHVVFHNLFDYLERAAPKLKTVSEIRSLAHLLEFLLEAHSRTEEELIVEPLDHCIDQIGQRETFHREHEEIDENLKRAQTARNPKQARAQLLAAVNRGEWALKGFRNRDIRTLLFGETKDKKQQRSQAAKVSRRLALLRAHGLIAKVSRTYRWQITEKAHRVLTALLAARQADTDKLISLAA